MLSVVSTPIGNLGDCSARMREVLTRCDAIVCEDTRVTGHLLSLIGLEKKPLISMHGYSDDSRLEHIAQLLTDGKHVALVSDAGTPGISDPGYAVVSRARSLGTHIEAIPGPAAFLVALSASGLPVDAFTYLGFLPLKKGRKTLIASIADMPHTVVFYESVHRVQRTLLELHGALQAQSDRTIVVARELTKLHEEVRCSPVRDLPALAASLTLKGEFVIVVGPPPRAKRTQHTEIAES